MDFGIRATTADASSPRIFSKCPGPTRQQTCAPADARLEQRRHVGAEPRPPRHLFGSRRSWIDSRTCLELGRSCQSAFGTRVGYSCHSQPKPRDSNSRPSHSRKGLPSIGAKSSRSVRLRFACLPVKDRSGYERNYEEHHENIGIFLDRGWLVKRTIPYRVSPALNNAVHHAPGPLAQPFEQVMSIRWSAGDGRFEWKRPSPGRGLAQHAIQSPYRSIAALAWPGVERRPTLRAMMPIHRGG